MAVEKMLFLFTIVVATSLAHTRLRWSNDGVFPNDYEWGRIKTKVSQQSENDVDAPSVKVCQTEECRKIASSLLGAMDESADPCEDFYQYTCGKFAADNPIPPSDVDINPLQIYQDLVHRRISEILEKEPDSDDILPVKKAKKWYRSCMDLEKLNRVGIAPIESLVNEIGGWPIAMKEDDWDSEDYPWQNIESYYASLTGRNAFYDVVGAPPSNDSGIGEIAIMEPELFLARMQLMQTPDYLVFLRNAVRSFIEHQGTALSERSYAKETVELIVFESKLMKLILHNRPVDPSEIGRHPMSFDEFVDWYESNTTKPPRATIHWQSAVQSSFDLLNVKINGASPTYVQNLGYIRQLGALLKNTKIRTIVNFVHWNYIADMLSRTTESMRDEIFKLGVLYQSFGGETKSSAECVKEMKMTYTAAYLFGKKYFPKSTQVAAQEMMKNIKIGLKANIDHSNWLDENSKILAKEKIDAMKIFTGFPEWYNNATAITEYYKDLTIGSEFLDNTLSYMRFERKAKLLGYTMTEEENNPTSMDHLTVNAEYNEAANALNTPPAVFQSPLFTPGLPDNVNYGQVGFLAGHEMGHGFDDTGIRHGKDGDESELSMNMLKGYYQRAHCFVDQFDKYFGVSAEPEDQENAGVTPEFDDLGDTRGSNTKSENIADSTGLQAVLRAYRSLNDGTGRVEPKLPGLESFTDEQLFFIAFGNYWCGSETPEYTAMTADDPHSPGNLRVNGAVSNTNDFAEVFGCPAGSAMNPSDKCSIWDKTGSRPKSSPAKRMRQHHNRWTNQWKH